MAYNLGKEANRRLARPALIAAAAALMTVGFVSGAAAQSRFDSSAGGTAAAWSTGRNDAYTATPNQYVRPDQGYAYAPAATNYRSGYVSPYARTQAAPLPYNAQAAAQRYNDQAAQAVALSALPGYQSPVTGGTVVSVAPAAATVTVPVAPPVDTSQVDLAGWSDGILIDISDRRIYWVEGSTILYSFQLGVPRYEEWVVYGDTTVTLKRPNPTWRPTPSMLERDPTLPVEVGPGPDNPLGRYALNTGFQYILIHGTNRPDSIGSAVSSGCFRLPDEGIELIFNLAKVGTPVRIRA